MLLLIAADKAIKANNLVDDVLEECGAGVIDDGNPKVVFMGLGNKSFSPVFKLPKQGPTTEINYVDLIVWDNIEELDKSL